MICFQNFGKFNMKDNNLNIEGYWYSKYEPEYPMPVPNVLTDNEATEIYSLIVEKQKIARRILYRGLSHSRITDETLGCDEYALNNWIWPGDFAEHYVLTHKVRPTDEFLNFIGYNYL